MNTYYGMKLDVTIASEPKNRKRGRPAATQNVCTSAQNFLDLALQAQALAAVGGQFSHLGFSNNTAPSLSLAASQYPAAAAAAAAAAANLTGLIPAMNVLNSGVPPLLGQAAIGGAGSQKSPSSTGYKSLMPNPHRGSGLNSLSASSSSAKRTRLETGSSGGGGSGSANSSGLPAGAAAARSANLVSLVTPKQDPFPPTTRATPRTSSTVASSAPLSVASRLPSTTSRPSTASSSHNNNNTQKYTHGIAAKFSDMKVGGSQEADRRQSSNGSAHPAGGELQQQQQGQQQQQRCHLYSEDILICGQCRHLFESVDVLIAHKMAGCSINKENGLTCRCKRNGEPDCLDCAYCGDTFSSAWELVSHCHTEHSLTIYAIPSQPPSPSSSTTAVSESARPTSPKRQHVSTAGKDLQRGRGCCTAAVPETSVLSRPANVCSPPHQPAKVEEQTEEEEEEEEEEEYDFEANTPQADVCEEEEEEVEVAVSEPDGTSHLHGAVPEIDEQDSNQATGSEAPALEQDSLIEEEDEEEGEEAQEHETEKRKQGEAESSKSDTQVDNRAKDDADRLERTEVSCAVLDDAMAGDARPGHQRTSFRRERRGSEHGRNETCTDDEEGEEYTGGRSS
ncbi:hypothetical protein SprV_0602063600 [Sparganum proliferum]